MVVSASHVLNLDTLNNCRELACVSEGSFHGNCWTCSNLWML